jgi:nucleoside phosphorylase
VLLVVAATPAELRCAAGAERLECGIGPVDAAIATAARLDESRPDMLLHVGIAGCRRGCGLEAGRIVIGSESLYSDTDSTLVTARVEPSRELLAAARAALPEAAVLPIGTSARIGGTSGCAVEGMEGFAVLRAAALAGVPALEVRAISNEIEDERDAWRIDDALAALDAAIPRLLEELAVHA